MRTLYIIPRLRVWKTWGAVVPLGSQDRAEYKENPESVPPHGPMPPP